MSHVVIGQVLAFFVVCFDKNNSNTNCDLMPFPWCLQVHELPADKLKSREVVPIDIANDSVATNDYKPTEDPAK